MNVQYFDPKDPINKLLAVSFFLAAFLYLDDAFFRIFKFSRSSALDAFSMALLSVAIAKNNAYPLAKHSWLWALIIGTALLAIAMLFVGTRIR